jgi:hypothetical protein
MSVVDSATLSLAQPSPYMSTTSPEQSSVKSGDSNSNSRDALASLRINRASGETTRRVRRRWPWAVLLLMLLGGGGGFYYWKKNPDDVSRLFSNNLATTTWVPDIIQNRPEVRLVAVNIQSGRSGDAVVVATGYLESRQQAKIGSRAAGRVQEINFEEGVEVKANDLLAVLEHRRRPLWPAPKPLLTNKKSRFANHS